MGLDLNTALISDTFDGLIKTTDGNVLTSSPLVITDGRGNDSSLALATAGNGVAITGTLTVDGVNIGSGLSTAQADITAIEAKTDFITVTGAVNLDTINSKAGFITVTQAVDLDTIESDIAVATAKTNFITVTQAVNLDTMESDILSAKTKTDFITISQAVNLDTVESGLATAQSDITAIEAKTDFITISSALNLNTVASNASAAKTKTDFLTVTQPVDLDTLESDVNVAKGDITAIEAKTDNITVTQAVNLDTMESDIADAKTKTDFITITQAVNLDTVESGLAQAQTDINQIEAKTNNITVTQAVNLDTMESDIAVNNAKNSYPAGDATKVGFISVTQAVDLDSMETDITNLSANKYDKTGGTISGSVVVTGDLTVNGTTTTVNTQTLSVKDPLIELANDNAANTVDTGFYANYSLDAGVTTKYAGLFKDASDSDKFKLFKGLEVEPTSSVDTAGTGYAKGDLVIGDLNADSGSISGTLSATTLGGTLSTAAQPNITSVGTLSSLDVGGDINVSNTSGAYLSIDTNSAAANAGVRLSESSTPTTNGAELVYDGADNKFHIKTGAASFTERLTIERDSGNVGIGTSSPAQALDVAGNINVSTGSSLYFGSTSVGILGNASGADYIAFSTNSGERMRIDSSGNLGVGTSSPAGKLSVLLGETNLSSASAAATTGYPLSIRFTGTASDANLIRHESSAAPSTYYTLMGTRYDNNKSFVINNKGSEIITYSDITSNGLGLSGGAGNLIRFDTNSLERMRISSAGYVGIGTSSPARVLHIEDSTTAAIQLENTSEADSFIDFMNPSRIFRVGYDDSADSFKIAVTNFNDNSLVVNSSGSVGIGSSSPVGKFEVNIGSSAAYFTRTAGDNGGSSPAFGILTDSSGSRLYSWGDGMKFYTGAVGGSPSERMLIDSSGVVQVRNQTPTIQLYNTDTSVAASQELGSIDFYTSDVSAARVSSYVKSIFDSAFGASYLTFGTSTGVSAPTERMRILSSGGITFNGDTAAANALDDYEEGTWTMGVAFGGASAGVTYADNTGSYTKIGRQVTVTGLLTLTNKGTSTGSFEITGLPFNIASGDENYTGVSIGYLSNVSFADYIQAWGEKNTSVIKFRETTNAGVQTNIDNTNLQNNSGFIFTLTYFV